MHPNHNQVHETKRQCDHLRSGAAGSAATWPESRTPLVERSLLHARSAAGDMSTMSSAPAPDVGGLIGAVNTIAMSVASEQSLTTSPIPSDTSQIASASVSPTPLSSSQSANAGVETADAPNSGVGLTTPAAHDTGAVSKITNSPSSFSTKLVNQKSTTALPSTTSQTSSPVIQSNYANTVGTKASPVPLSAGIIAAVVFPCIVILVVLFAVPYWFSKHRSYRRNNMKKKVANTLENSEDMQGSPVITGATSKGKWKLGKLTVSTPITETGVNTTNAHNNSRLNSWHNGSELLHRVDTFEIINPTMLNNYTSPEASSGSHGGEQEIPELQHCPLTTRDEAHARRHEKSVPSLPPSQGATKEKSRFSEDSHTKGHWLSVASYVSQGKDMLRKHSFERAKRDSNHHQKNPEAPNNRQTRVLHAIIDSYHTDSPPPPPPPPRPPGHATRFHEQL